MLSINTILSFSRGDETVVTRWHNRIQNFKEVKLKSVQKSMHIAYCSRNEDTKEDN